MPYTSEVDSRSPPARVILDWSAGYDLLALGAPASSWPAMWLSVGVGNKAIEGFTAPLLVARPLEAERRFGDRIVVASDGLEASNGLVDLAGRLAHEHGSKVTLVHALGRESPLKRGRPREQERTLEEQDGALKRALASGVSEVLVEPGRAQDVIKSVAAAVDASLVVDGKPQAGRATSDGECQQAGCAPGAVLRAPLPARDAHAADLGSHCRRG